MEKKLNRATEIQAAAPVAWVRYRIDGCFEGPIMDSQMDEVRKKSGAWTPLYAEAHAVHAEPVEWKQELLDWVSACQSAYHIDNTPGHRFGFIGSNLEENRAAVVEYVSRLITSAQPVNQQLLDVANSILAPDIIDLLPAEYVARVKHAITAAESAQAQEGGAA